MQAEQRRENGGDCVEIRIIGTPTEIAALVVALQERQPITLNGDAIADIILDHTSEDRPLEGLL